MAAAAGAHLLGGDGAGIDRQDRKLQVAFWALELVSGALADHRGVGLPAPLAEREAAHLDGGAAAQEDQPSHFLSTSSARTGPMTPVNWMPMPSGPWRWRSQTTLPRTCIGMSLSSSVTSRSTSVPMGSGLEVRTNRPPGERSVTR